MHHYAFYDTPPWQDFIIHGKRYGVLGKNIEWTCVLHCFLQAHTSQPPVLPPSNHILKRETTRMGTSTSDVEICIHCVYWLGSP